MTRGFLRVLIQRDGDEFKLSIGKVICFLSASCLLVFSFALSFRSLSPATRRTARGNVLASLRVPTRAAVRQWLHAGQSPVDALCFALSLRQMAGFRRSASPNAARLTELPETRLPRESASVPSAD